MVQDRSQDEAWRARYEASKASGVERVQRASGMTPRRESGPWTPRTPRETPPARSTLTPRNATPSAAHTPLQRKGAFASPVRARVADDAPTLHAEAPTARTWKERAQEWYVACLTQGAAAPGCGAVDLARHRDGARAGSVRARAGCADCSYAACALAPLAAHAARLGIRTARRLVELQAAEPAQGAHAPVFRPAPRRRGQGVLGVPRSHARGAAHGCAHVYSTSLLLRSRACSRSP